MGGERGDKGVGARKRFRFGTSPPMHAPPPPKQNPGAESRTLVQVAGPCECPTLEVGRGRGPYNLSTNLVTLQPHEGRGGEGGDKRVGADALAFWYVSTDACVPPRARATPHRTLLHPSIRTNLNVKVLSLRFVLDSFRFFWRGAFLRAVGGGERPSTDARVHPTRAAPRRTLLHPKFGFVKGRIR